MAPKKAKALKYPLPFECRASIVKDFEEFFTSRANVSFRHQYQAKSLLSKYADPDPKSSSERRAAAIRKWIAVESRNASTNHRLFTQITGDRIAINLRNRVHAYQWSPALKGDNCLQYSDVSFDELIADAARLVKHVIGSRPRKHTLRGKFSGGASTSLRRAPGVFYRKYSSTLDVTESAWYEVYPHLMPIELWADVNPEVFVPRVVSNSVMFTVPKNNTIDRVACKEPDLNMWGQRAVGDYFRSRLLHKAHINLNDQTINQYFASIAIAHGLATVDLSSASDSVTTQLVCRMLPTEWFVYLDRLRVPAVRIPLAANLFCDDYGSPYLETSREGKDVFHRMEMFSTMGNGFTFELESLIFWALAQAVVRRLFFSHLDITTQRGFEQLRKATEWLVSVFGDDIIMPDGAYHCFVKLMNYCGFKVNHDKSFVGGYFKESCGKHFALDLETPASAKYTDPADVTPIFIKKPVDDVPSLIRLLNRLRKWACGNGAHSWCDSDVYPLWNKYAKYVPTRLWGGYDLESTQTLVSAIGPGYRLVPESVPLKDDPRESLERGRYVAWHAGCSTIVTSSNRQIKSVDGQQRPSGLEQWIPGALLRVGDSIVPVGTIITDAHAGFQPPWMNASSEIVDESSSGVPRRLTGRYFIKKQRLDGRAFGLERPIFPDEYTG